MNMYVEPTGSPSANDYGLDVDGPEVSTIEEVVPSGSLTYLDPDETSVGFDGEACTPYSPPSPLDPGVSFRHSGWTHKREIARSCMVVGGCGQASIERFDGCGGRAWVLKSKQTPGLYRIASDRCHCRWCEPCAYEYRRKVCGNLQTWLLDTFHLKSDAEITTRLRFITLTLKSTDKTLNEQLDRFVGCFRNLRAKTFWKANVEGGIYFFEITHNQRTGLWHPHCHIICSGKYVAQKKLADLLKEVTGDSFIVDVRKVPTARWAVSYVAKYAGKGIPADVRSNPDLLLQAVFAFKGRRLFSTFGNWKSLKLSENDPAGDEWETVCSLTSLIRKAAGGDPEAVALLHYLTGRGQYDKSNHQSEHDQGS